jgi:hypothetical protein
MRTLGRILLVALCLSTLSVAATPAIKADELLAHIKFLASDALKGRGGGSPELELAAEYVARQFKAAGLRPGGTSQDWFQPFGLQAGLEVGAGNALVFKTGSRATRLTLGESYYPLAAPVNDTPTQPSTTLDGVPRVFAGYGISAAHLNYDDYAGVDVSGKAVLIFSHEPQENDRSSRLNGNQAIPE